MKNSFTPSVNLVRDFGNNLTYLPSGNSRRLYENIVTDFKTGIRSFNIVGSYGTGKSAFLWAIEKQLCNKAKYFGHVNGHFRGVKRFEPINIVGDYSSIVQCFARRVGLASTRTTEERIFKQLAAICEQAAKNQVGLLIVIDELGKFLEYAARNEPERELYFIQQLAEFCNDSTKSILLLTSLHQGFVSYARGLDQTQRIEWEKVKGRLRELPFNENVDHLLFLAAQYLRFQDIDRGITQRIDSIVGFTETSRACKFDDHSASSIAKSLLPLEPLSAGILALALQKYGQNERSLFTFLSSQDHLGIRGFDRRSNPLYNLSCVYDYLIANHYSFIVARENPHYVQWAAIQRAIERVEGLFDGNSESALKLVKSIGLLNIFALDGARIDHTFIDAYGRTALGITDPIPVVKALEEKKLIRYRQFKNRYLLFEGTDFDFGAAFASASSRVDEVVDVVPRLESYFTFPALHCKAVHLKRGTPRYFEFRISNEPLIKPPQGQFDGIINLVFPIDGRSDELKDVAAKHREAIIYCVFSNVGAIRKVLWEIEKMILLGREITNDLVASRELRSLLDHQIRELNRMVRHSVFEETATWVFHGKEIKIRSQLTLNKYLSSVVEQIYHHTPKFQNELINRHRLPPAVVTARRNLIDNLIANWDKEDLGFPAEKFPPEKTIYLALLKETGIHRKRSDGWSVGKPTDESFYPLWTHCEGFLAEAKSARRCVLDLFERLLSRPIKLKKGFVDIWVPLYLFIRREDYALFGEDGYIPQLTGEVVDLILKNPDKYWIKTFDIGGVRLDLLNRYRTILSKQPTHKISSASFIDTIRPFLTFYRGLPGYCKTTQRLTQPTVALREAIASARDPEKAFFEDFPAALGYDLENLRCEDKNLHDYVVKLQDAIREMRACFDNLIDRIERSLIDHAGYEGIAFPEYRERLRARFLSLREYLLLPHQRTLFQRLMSEIDDRKAWLSSIAQCALGRPIELMNDNEEKAVHDKLLSGIQELDDLCELTKAKVDPAVEEAIRFETTTLAGGTKKRLLRIAKSKTSEADHLAKKIKTLLSSDRSLNSAALLKLLMEINANE